MIKRLLVELLLAVAVGAAVYLVATGAARGRPAAPAGALKGFAGWLLVLAVAQWLAVLLLAGELLRQLAHDQRTAALVDAIGPLAVLGFVLWAAIAMTRRRRVFPGLLRIELVLLVVLTVLDIFWAIPDTATFVTGPKLWLAVALRLAVTGLVAAACFVYSLRSARLRNTFVR